MFFLKICREFGQITAKGEGRARGGAGRVALATQHAGRRGELEFELKRKGRRMASSEGKGCVSENPRHNFASLHEEISLAPSRLFRYSTLNRPTLHVVLAFSPRCFRHRNEGNFPVFYADFARTAADDATSFAFLERKFPCKWLIVNGD